MPLPLVINPGDLGHIGDHETIDALLVNIVSPFVVAGIAFGTHAARPAAGHAGVFYIETDTGITVYDNGAAWVAVTSADATKLTQKEIFHDSTNHGLTTTANTVVYTTAAHLPSGWTTFDLYISGTLQVNYASGTGLRRYVAQVCIGATTQPDAGGATFEDIAGNGTNRGIETPLRNNVAGLNADTTVTIQAWLNVGSGNVTAGWADLEMTKLRRS